MGESGWRVHLLDGPYDGARAELLAPGLLTYPPPYVDVSKCPCCGQVAALAPDDPRGAELLEWGAPHPVAYVLEGEALLTRQAHYRWVQSSPAGAAEKVAVAG